MMRSWLPLLLAVVPVVAAEKPKPPPPADMPKLLTLYQEYGLPLPPPEAPLVRIPTGARTIAEDGTEKDLHTLAFLIKPAVGENPPELLVGPFLIGDEKPEKIEIIDPAKIRPDEIEFEWNTQFPCNTGPAMAVQLFQRGHAELANKLLIASVPKYEDGGPAAVSSGGEWKQHRGSLSSGGRPGDHPELLLARMAWSFWLNETMSADSDWNNVVERLEKIIVRNPEFDDESKQKFIASLKAALKPSGAAPGSVEEAIDGLVRCKGRFSSMMNEIEDGSYQKVAALGFAAIPALIEHLDDPRMTRSLMVGFNNFPTMPRTVGEIAGDLLDDLLGQRQDGAWLNRQLGQTGSRARYETLWREAEKAGEEHYFVSQIFPPVGENNIHLHEKRLEIIAAKYPNRLPEIYLTLLENRPELQAHAIVEAIVKSPLPREEKLRLLNKGISHKNLAQQLTALDQLRNLDAAEADRILLAIVEKLPKKTKGSVWISPESRVSHLVMDSESPAVWAAFLKTAKRSHISLRLELMNPLDYSYAGDKQLKQRIDFLAAFLDDTAERIKSQDEELYSGPCAGFHFPRITVRNFAAMQIASLLKFAEEPDEKWTEKQWSVLRKKVRAALPK